MMWKNTGRGGMKGQKKSEKKRDQINRKEKWGQLIALMTGRRVMKRGPKGGMGNVVQECNVSLPASFLLQKRAWNSSSSIESQGCIN